MSHKVWKFGSDIDTDQIIAARYLVTTDKEELGQHCLENSHPRFAQEVRAGDVIVAAKNFGCGSSREHAPLALIGAGVHAVIASSFARIFFRNSINLGLLLIECPRAHEIFEEGQSLEIDPSNEWIIQQGTNQRSSYQGPTGIVKEILDAGGLMQHIAGRFPDKILPAKAMEV